MVPEDLLSVNNLGTNFKLLIKGSGSSVISFLKAKGQLPVFCLHIGT
jgi:hypothetical protein